MKTPDEYTVPRSEESPIVESYGKPYLRGTECDIL
jgi:hypothetical protein